MGQAVVVRRLTVASILTLVLSLQAGAWAQPAAPKSAPQSVAKSAPKSAQQERFDGALQKLASGDPVTVQIGIVALVETGGPAAERALTERVAAGLPPSLIEPALSGLVALKAKKSIPVLIELLGHRRALVRSAALQALAQLDTRKPSPLQATFVAALDDSASEVSRAAAQGLGQIGTKTALPALWAAYDRGNTPALASIAELAGPETVELLVTRAQTSGLGVVEPVLDRMMARNALPSSAQVKLVRAVVALKSEDGRQYLLKWLDRIKLQSQAQVSQVKKELFDGLKALSAPQTPAGTNAAQVVAVKGADKAGAR